MKQYFKTIKIGCHTLNFNSLEHYNEFLKRMSYPLINR